MMPVRVWWLWARSVVMRWARLVARVAVRRGIIADFAVRASGLFGGVGGVPVGVIRAGKSSALPGVVM